MTPRVTGSLRLSRRLVLGTVRVLGGLLVVLVVLVAVVYARVRVPDVARLSMPTATRYEYSDGTVFYTAGLQNRVIVPLSQMPPVLRQAVVAVETRASGRTPVSHRAG